MIVFFVRAPRLYKGVIESMLSDAFLLRIITTNSLALEKEIGRKKNKDAYGSIQFNEDFLLQVKQPAISNLTVSAKAQDDSAHQISCILRQQIFMKLQVPFKE